MPIRVRHTDDHVDGACDGTCTGVGGCILYAFTMNGFFFLILNIEIFSKNMLFQALPCIVTFFVMGNHAGAGEAMYGALARSTFTLAGPVGTCVSGIPTSAPTSAPSAPTEGASVGPQKVMQTNMT